MVSNEHKLLAQYLKDVHSSLRQTSAKDGAEKAWLEHCNKKETLATYAKCMAQLAIQHWDVTYASENTTTSRITWTADIIYDYFINKSYLKYKQKEYEIAEKIGVEICNEEKFIDPLQLIDVGSCYNPFKRYDFLNVFAIDLYPENETVVKCDFLNVALGNNNIVHNNKATELKKDFFDIVTFCFLLEYLPNSDFRISACKKAYDILKPGGLLIINTPDSKHVGANCKMMKCWRYALACMGFSRIKYEKLKHMHCMAFRKALNKETAERWAKISKESYMEYAIHIPQDFNAGDDVEVKPSLTDIEVSPADFDELPFGDVLNLIKLPLHTV